MLDDLPSEIIILIVETAAHSFLFTNPTTVVQLALASKAIYAIISPILYKNIVVTSGNKIAIKALVQSDAAATRVLVHTRSIIGNYDLGTDVFDPSLLPKLERVKGNGSFVSSMVEVCRIRDVQVWSSWFPDAMTQLPTPGRANITHAAGFIVDSAAGGISDSVYQEFMLDPGAWTRRIVDVLPSLTHLAFELFQIIDEENADDDDRSAVSNFSMHALGEVLRAALSYQALQMVAVRVVGDYLRRSGEVVSVLLSIGDERLKIWSDDRSRNSYLRDEELDLEDVYEGRSIWTEARLPTDTVNSPTIQLEV
ncbi:hypothetical protein BKA62DRAFT_688476 [Auriculariales sp. MPI-PUGE-AT-0066]|nr:hypothetical protein BKA62DRAFT_688476 [Auriculariales sp. MPI-PUGE-AT-0066]